MAGDKRGQAQGAVQASAGELTVGSQSTVDSPQSTEKRPSRVTRYPDWERRFAEAVAVEAAHPFDWGGNDCCLTPCNLVLAVTGVDLAAAFRGQYTTAAGARQAMKAFAGGGVEEVAARVAAELGISEVAPAFARRGDVVVIDIEKAGPMLGVVDFDGMHALVRVKAGLDRVPVAAARRAWRIG